MFQMIEYRSRDKGEIIKLENPMTENLVLDMTGNNPQYPIWKINFCLVLVKFCISL
jgi:hypothetical protein